MERRKYRALQRRKVLLTILRYLVLAAVIAAGIFVVKHVWTRSAVEVAQVKDRPPGEYYIVIDKPVRMAVVDDSGIMSMEISGQEVRLSNDQRNAEFIGAEAFFYKDGKRAVPDPSLHMKAGEIIYDTQTEDFMLTQGDLGQPLWIKTNDGMEVTANVVEWRPVKSPPDNAKFNAQQFPSFRFPEGVFVTQQGSSGHNTIKASYMQADKDITYMEFVGDVSGTLSQLKDTQFISDRELTDVDDLKLEDMEELAFRAEKVIYDRNKEVLLATSRSYDREFPIVDMDGREVRVEDYTTAVTPVTFSKEEITIDCDHLEAHVEKQVAFCLGNINMLIPEATPEEGDDPALKSVKQHESRIYTSDVEYFWGRDHIITHARTRMEQDDRLALADRITYWGDQKMVLLDGNLSIVQGSGKWLIEDNLITVGDHDQSRAVTAYTELYAERAVVYLDNNDFIASGDVEMRQDERDVAADTIVYQDEIKRITAQGNIKFRDKDGQALLCSNLVYYNDDDYMEVTGGASASLKLPAKYANDINRALAETREEEVPPEIEDPPVGDEPPDRNPNAGSLLAGATMPLAIPEAPPEDDEGAEGPVGTLVSNGEMPLLLVPTAPGGDGVRELIIELGPEDESATEPEGESEEETG